MALKLLPPSQTQFQTRARSEKDERRAVELQELVVKKHRELSDIEKLSEEALTRNRAIWVAEEESHLLRVGELTKEVVALEERKKEAIVPLTKRKEELDTVASALRTLKESLDARRADLDEESDLLKVRLDEVSERAIQLDSRNAQLASQEEGVQAQVEHLRLTSEGFTETMAQTASAHREKERVLELREAKVHTKEMYVAERERIVKEKEKTFADRERAIQDAYETLERTKKRT